MLQEGYQEELQLEGYVPIHTNILPKLQYHTGSKSFMRKRATSLQNLVGSLNTDEKSKDKKEFYSDVNLSNCAPEGQGEDKEGEHINNPEEKYLNFVEESFELDMEEGIELSVH